LKQNKCTPTTITASNIRNDRPTLPRFVVEVDGAEEDEEFSKIEQQIESGEDLMYWEFERVPEKSCKPLPRVEYARLSRTSTGWDITVSEVSKVDLSAGGA
jgi:hypothetical protein